MDVNAAKKIAREYLIDLFDDENITGVGVEEIVRDHETDQWRITFGFARPPEQTTNLATLWGLTTTRAYKTVHVNDDDGAVTAVTDRLLPDFQS